MTPVETHHLNIAELIVAGEPAIISTVLGSCVSVCLFNRKQSAGGMIHFALAKPPPEGIAEEGLRYGSLAIECLIKEMRDLTGEDPGQFLAKIVGGAADTGGQSSSYPVGKENIAIAKQILAKYRIPVVGESTGGDCGKKVLFHIPSGRVQVALLRSTVRAVEVPSFAVQKPVQVESPGRRKVLIVDDSKVIRDLLKRILSEDSSLEVVGMAADPLEAEELVIKFKPDVITLDIHMPKMSGVEWLERLLPRDPRPVVMISSLQFKEGNEVFRALELGAVDYIQKPTLAELKVVGPIIREKVKAASWAQVRRAERPAKKIALGGPVDMRKVLAVGASTGGTEALKSIFCCLPKEIPPTIIVQHIPPIFSKAFADRLNSLCPFEVKEAEDGDELRSSRVLIAPGGKQMKVKSTAKGLVVEINDDEPMSRHKPSVDYLFHSVASVLGPRALGVILTGMGADGAKGLLEMKKRGAQTLGQDEESCVVYGMPRVAYEMGAVQQQASLEDIPQLIMNMLSLRMSA